MQPPVSGWCALLGLSGRGHELLQFALIEHFLHDVRAADEFAADIQLWDGGPVAVCFDALAHGFVF